MVDEQNAGTLEFETDEVFQSSEAVLPPHLDKRLAANGLDPEAGGYSARGGGTPFCRSSVSSPEIGLNHLSAISETDPDAAVNDRSYLSVPLRQSLSYSKGRASVLQSLTSSDMLSPGAIGMSPLFKRTSKNFLLTFIRFSTKLVFLIYFNLLLQLMLGMTKCNPKAVELRS